MNIITRSLFKSSFKPFLTRCFASEITSVPGNKPPLSEDNIPGKYAGVLFAGASSSENLHNVLEDMKFFKELSAKSEVWT
jgi:hypothetical protein